MAITVSTTAGTTISVSVSGSTQVSFATTTNSVSVTQPASSSISVLGKGTKGDTGATGTTGATGATGAAGADGRSYAISCVDGDNGDEEKIRLSDSAGVNDDVVLEAGTGLSIARDGDKITFTNTITDTDTVLTSEQVQDIVGAMFSGNTETRISATYQDGDGNIDLVVDAIPVDLTSDGAGTIHANNVPTLNQSTTGNAETVTTNANLTGHITSTGNAAVLGSFSVAQLSAALSDASISGNNTGDQTTVSGSSGSCTGNAATATALATARAINGVNFDGTAPITVTAAGSTLSDTVTVAKGGTGATSLTSDSVLTGAGTSAVVAEANLTFDGSILTVTGQRKIPSTTSSSQYYGDVVAFGRGPAGADGDIEAGKLYYLDSSQQWEQTNANAASTATGMIAIAVVDDNARYLVKGLARHSSWSGFTTGDVLYVSGTPGEITKTAPTGSADIVRIVGYCTNGSEREIYFDPSKDWVELS